MRRRWPDSLRVLRTAIYLRDFLRRFFYCMVMDNRFAPQQIPLPHRLFCAAAFPWHVTEDLVNVKCNKLLDMLEGIDSDLIGGVHIYPASSRTRQAQSDSQARSKKPLPTHLHLMLASCVKIEPVTVIVAWREVVMMSDLDVDVPVEIGTTLVREVNRRVGEYNTDADLAQVQSAADAGCYRGFNSHNRNRCSGHAAAKEIQ